MRATDRADALVAPAASSSGPPLLRPLRVRDFRLLFSGETISVLGDHFHFVALAWLTLQLTGSGLALGSVLMVAAIPRAIFMLVGGALSDRLSPRSLMLYSNAIRAVLVGIIATLVLTGNVQLWQLYVMAGIFGVVDALFYPAVSAILPMLVVEADLPPANALMQGSQQLATLLGPALAGLLVALVAPNVPVAFGLLAVIGVGAGFINVHVVSWLQGRTAEEMRGRVMSMVMLGSVGLAPVSYALAGLIVDIGPVPVMFAVAGAIVTGAALIGFASGVAGRMTYPPVEAGEA